MNTIKKPVSLENSLKKKDRLLVMLGLPCFLLSAMITWWYFKEVNLFMGLATIALYFVFYFIAFAFVLSNKKATPTTLLELINYAHQQGIDISELEKNAHMAIAKNAPAKELGRIYSKIETAVNVEIFKRSKKLY